MTETELFARLFRTPPEYEVVVADGMSGDELRAAGEMASAPDFYGVLRPRPAGAGSPARPTRAINRETALLLLTLRVPGPFPSFARSGLGREAVQVLRRWIADGVLEVELDGEFVSGARALAGWGALPGPEGSGRLARLSRTALASAARLTGASAGRRAFHLYTAGRLPVSRRWRERLPDGEAVAAFLARGLPAEASSRFERSWEASHRTERWLHWRARSGSAPQATRREGESGYKLYVSPQAEGLSATWGSLVEALSASGAFELKVGAGAAGLLRPDKVVAYFATREQLSRAAEDLLSRLAGLPAHGVPFTAEIGLDGLLSWGIDPPQSPQPDRSVEEGEAWRAASELGESWRSRLCTELGRDLAAACGQGETPDGAVRFALARARLRGIEPGDWSPAESREREPGSRP